MQLGPDRYLDARDPEKSSIARWEKGPGTVVSFVCGYVEEAGEGGGQG